MLLTKKKKFGRTADRPTDRQADGNWRPISSYSGDHERSIKHKTKESADGLDYNHSLAYAQEVKKVTESLKGNVII